MPTPGLTFRAGPSTVTLDGNGTVSSVRHDARPDRSYLVAAGGVAVFVAGQPTPRSAPTLTVDADEVEISHRAGERLSVVVRHSFATHWVVRLALTNLTAETLSLDEVVLQWVPGEDAPAWSLAAGAVGSYAVGTPDGHGPWLGGVLRVGRLDSVSPEGLGLGAIVLDPGGRYVVQWQWSWFPHPRACSNALWNQPGDRQVPRTLCLTTGEAAAISASEDEALVLGAGLSADPVRDQVELVAPGPGTFPVELRSARGVTRFHLQWVEPVEALLIRAAELALAGARTPAGVVRLTSVDAALAVQFALRVGLDDADTATDALELFTARLAEPSELDPGTASFLCGEFDRTGEVELLEAATDALLAATGIVPGLGLAASQVGLARLLAGLSPDALTRQVAGLAADSVAPGSGTVSEQAAALELAVLTSDAGSARDLIARVSALGGWLGAGLKGHPVRPLPVGTVAHQCAVFAMLADEVSVGLRTRWACTAHELGRWTEATVIARLADTPAGPAHSWLAAAARTR